MNNEVKIYSMKMNLNVLNHLGIRLYSNVPSVLSEVVANSWDADAKEIRIVVSDEKIEIRDNGVGMSIEEVNNRYLLVGFEKRKNGQQLTEELKRPVMGRKGIGKLALFSIADVIEVHTKKSNDAAHALRMDSREIEKVMDGESGAGVYHPEKIDVDWAELGERGTKIVISSLKKKRRITVGALRKRLARRFSLIGRVADFKVFVNGEEILANERDYFSKVQYLWAYGDEAETFKGECSPSKLKHFEKRDALTLPSRLKVSGWIASAENSAELRDPETGDNINNIGILVRGRIAQEDILAELGEVGVYSKYLFGEISADVLDVDDKEDITTSSRQDIRKDDERYVEVKSFVLNEIKHIKKIWTDLRNQSGKEEAFKNPAISEWFLSLGPDAKRKAEILFGKINQISVDSDVEKRALFKHGVLAFETLRYKENLDALENLTPDNIQEFGRILGDYDDIEASLYHQVVTERIGIIKKLLIQVEDDVLEKVLQGYLNKHLWLLDSSWDRPTETPILEEQVRTAFAGISAGLSDEEKLGRIDIKYKKVSGKHVIVELKRSSRSVNSNDLAKQVRKYISALRKLLDQSEETRKEPIEAVCILGKKCSDWTDVGEEDASRAALAQHHIRVVFYRGLAIDAERNYSAFLEKQAEAGRVTRLLAKIDEGDVS